MSHPDCVEHVIELPCDVPTVLAAGAWFKNTLCVTTGRHAYVTRSVGDLDTPAACCAHERAAQELVDWLAHKPRAIVHDLHPDFHSSRHAARLAAELAVPLLAVQHHHAHVAAVCAEHGVTEPVLGLALDGVGLGTDGTAWGGELLRVHAGTCERVGHLRPLPLPGGDRAAREPWRMSAAVLHELGHNGEIARRYADEPAAATVAAMLQRDLNCPRTSSMGRVFDVAAAALGLCRKMEFEAQAAIALEQAATGHIAAHGWPQPLSDGWRIGESGDLDPLPLLAALHDMQDAAYGAALFHATLVAALADMVRQAMQRTGLTTIACGGGCFFNRLLSAGLRERFATTGVRMLSARTLLSGDTAIALGQAWIAGCLLQDNHP